MADWDEDKVAGFKPKFDEWYQKVIDAIKVASTVENLQNELDLSAAGRDIVILHALENLVILGLDVVFLEASSADTGVIIRVGKESDNDYFYTGTSEISQSQYDEETLTLLNDDLDAGDSLTVGTAGGKVGAGTVAFIVRYVKR